MFRKHLVVATLPLAAVALLGGHAAANPTPTDFTTPAESAAPSGIRTPADFATPAESAAPSATPTPADFATPSETASNLSRHETSLRFLDVRDQAFALDVGDSGDSPGDVLFFNNLLRTRDDTADAGRFASSCTLLPGELYRCQGTLLLARSTIELATSTDFSAPITAAVTGGTGAHEGAAGQVRITPTDNPDRSRLHVHLTRPSA